MAIEPFRQRIGVPGGAGVTQQGVGRVADVGEAITGLAGTAMQVMEPRLKRAAIDQGQQDAARTVIGKDENGNYVMPDTPEGGDVYAAAFDQAKREQYKLLVLNDAELEFNRIYSDPANIGKSPEEMRYLAENYLQGVMGAVDPFVENDIYEGLSREIRQRDLAANNAWLRQEAALMERGFASKIERAEGDAIEAYANGGEAEGDRLKGEGRAALEQLVKLRMRAPEELDAWDARFVSVRAGGEFLQGVRGDLGDGTLFADDLMTIQHMLLGTDGEGTTVIVDGKPVTGETLRAMIPDERVRTSLVSKLNGREADLRRQEAEDEQKNEAIDLMAAVPMGGNKPYGVSEEKWAAAWQAWADSSGVDLLSPEGVVRAYHRSPDLPTGLYQQTFANMNARTGPELERILPLYQTMQNMLGRDGQSVNIAETLLKPEDSAYLYHYSAARRMGAGPADAITRARTATSAGLGKPSDELRAKLREAGGYTDNATLFDKLDDEVGVDWKSLNPRAQDAIQLDVAQQVAMGVPIDTARKSAGTRFKANWTRQRYTLDSAFNNAKGYDDAWVEKGNALPTVTNWRNPSQQTDAWVSPYVNEAIKTWGGQQLPGVPEQKDLLMGKNIWLQPTGRTTGAGGTQYAVVYWDAKLGNPPTVLMDKQGMPIQLEFGRAQAKQQAALNSFFKNRAVSERQVNQVKTRTAPGTYMPGSGAGITAVTPGLAAEQARHREQFGQFKYQIDLRDVAPPGGQQDILAGPANNWPGVARAVAGRFGLRADHVATVFSYETGGKFDPDVWGGKDNNHFGLIQFGGPEREQFLKPLLKGKRYEDATPQQWAQAIGDYLEERGFRRGMNILDLYSTINAGSPGRYKASDNGGKDTVQSHVQRMLRDHLPQARRWLAGG